MSVTIRLTIEDITTQLLTYNQIRIWMATTLGGSYTEQTDLDITLVAGTYHYSVVDSDGDLNKWYKYDLYNDPGGAAGVKSDPFRVAGTTRLRIRQEALARYGAGIVLVNTGTDADKITTSDYRFKTSLFKTNRHRGKWLYAAVSTNNAGESRTILSTVPTDGTLTVLPVFGGNFANNDEVELHSLANPTVWADAINRGLDRYWYVEIVPIVPGSDNDYSLAGIPWLTDRGQIHDLRWFPTSTIEVDESYVGNGRWWDVKKDGDVLTLIIKPAVSTTQIMYLETTRPMPRLYTDAAALPNVANTALAAALAYDEVLKHLGSHSVGTAESRASYRMARRGHRPELIRLLKANRPKPRFSPGKLPYPPIVSQPFKAR